MNDILKASLTVQLYWMHDPLRSMYALSLHKQSKSPKEQGDEDRVVATQLIWYISQLRRWVVREQDIRRSLKAAGSPVRDHRMWRCCRLSSGRRRSKPYKRDPGTLKGALCFIWPVKRTGLQLFMRHLAWREEKDKRQNGLSTVWTGVRPGI